MAKLSEANEHIFNNLYISIAFNWIWKILMAIKVLFPGALCILHICVYQPALLINYKFIQIWKQEILITIHE